MNEVRLKGRITKAPTVFGKGVRITIQPEGENGFRRCTAWTGDAPEAVRVLSEAREGDLVTILGRCASQKDKRLRNVDEHGAVIASDGVWAEYTSVTRARIDGAAAPKAAKPNDDEIPW